MDGEETSSNQSEPQASNSDQMLASDCVDKPQSSPSEAGEESVPSITVTAGKTHMKIYPDLGGGAVKPPAKKIMRRTEIGADGKKKLFWDLLPWDDVYDPATAQWTPEDFLPKDGTTVDPMIKGLAQIASRLLWDGKCNKNTGIPPKHEVADCVCPPEVCWPGRITYEGAVRYWMKTFSVINPNGDPVRGTERAMKNNMGVPNGFSFKQWCEWHMVNSGVAANWEMMACSMEEQEAAIATRKVASQREHEDSRALWLEKDRIAEAERRIKAGSGNAKVRLQLKQARRTLEDIEKRALIVHPRGTNREEARLAEEAKASEKAEQDAKEAKIREAEAALYAEADEALAEMASLDLNEELRKMAEEMGGDSSLFGGGSSLMGGGSSLLGPPKQAESRGGAGGNGNAASATSEGQGEGDKGKKKRSRGGKKKKR